MSVGPTTFAFKGQLADQIAAAVPWLPRAQIYVTRPPIPYNGPVPWALLRSPRLHAQHTEAETVGTPETTPNRYTLFYFENPYVAGSDQAAEEERVDATYDRVTQLLLPPFGDIPCPAGQYAYCAGVDSETHESGPYLTWGGQPWIGSLFALAIVQEFG